MNIQVKKKRPSYLKLVVDNGKLINEAYELAKEQQKLIVDLVALQSQITLAKIKEKELIEGIDKFEKQIDKLERKVNGTTIKRTTGERSDKN